MADPTTRLPHPTRAVETTRGLLTYAELAPLLAERVQRVQEAITRGDHDGAVPGRDLVCALHAAIWEQRLAAPLDQSPLQTAQEICVIGEIGG